MGRREPGTHIEGVFRIGADPFIVMPLTVVEDSPDRIAHYIAPGTHYLRRQLLDGSPVPRVVRVDELRQRGSRLAPAQWRLATLVVTDPQAAHAIRHRWGPGTWEFEGWYVNLQRPLERTVTGFDTEDHFLDILVRPDCTWSWKDEDELEEAVEHGRLTRSEADAVRREGEAVIARIESRAFPFDSSLVDWRPDPRWTVTALRDEWNARQ